MHAIHTARWWRHMGWLLLAFVPLALLFASTDLDLNIARRLFFDTEHLRWVGAGNWWIEAVLHTGGRWFVRALVASAGIAWLATHIEPSWRPLRRPAAYFVVATVLAVGSVGLLKTVTNVDCPWDLANFGGQMPFVHLFAHRAASLRHARCFPAAHASSGYALIALYFVARERSLTLARAGLFVGVLVGVVFGLAQQARGAHFVSHDLWSAYLVWCIVGSVYVFVFKARLGEPLEGVAQEKGLASTGGSRQIIPAAEIPPHR